ncbi:TPA: 30S ribosomal protein S6 [Candidatus Poribacteria bacterium]|nr:30S ribosomal protein S6 [Candidatus Poribacteria bacterium]
MRRLYETIFIINPDSENAVFEQTIADVRNLIESNGYEVKKLDPWGRRRLAYEVKGHTEGYYVLMVFESEPDFIEQLQRHYRITESIIKYMVVNFEGNLTQPLPEAAENQTEEVSNIEQGSEGVEK